MKEFEELLKEGKKELDNVEVPLELESRLRCAIEDKNSPKRRGFSWKIRIAVLLIVFIVAGYNYDTLAYYGKKLIGYDTVMNKTLNELNALGKGQVIGKKYTFKNGVILSLDGVMIDDNQLLAFYTIKDPEGVKDVSSFSLIDTKFKGLFNEYYGRSGRGEMNDNKSQVKWVSSFEPPKFYERTLEFKFSMMKNNKSEEGKISFKLDRSKAMDHTIKKSINKAITVDETNIFFKSIMASPTTTVIKGNIEDTLSLIIDKIKGERFRPNHLKVKLYANGEEVQTQGTGISTNMKGITFDLEYDALPKDLKSLKLKLISFSADHDVDKTINLVKGGDKKSFDILGENIEINRVYEKENNTYITITTNEDTILTDVYLMVDGERFELIKTIKGEYEKQRNGNILYRRTLYFNSIGDDIRLKVNRMTYVKEYNKEIDIPLE